MLQRIHHLLLSLDESDVYLSVGVAFLFSGVFLIYPPAAYISLGLIFCGIAYLEELKGVTNGSS